MPSLDMHWYHLKKRMGDVSGRDWSVQIDFGRHHSIRTRGDSVVFLRHLQDDLWKIVPDACCNSNFLKHCWEACAPSSWTVWNVPAVSIDVWNHRCEIDLGLFNANGNLLCWDLKKRPQVCGKNGKIVLNYCIHLHILPSFRSVRFFYVFDAHQVCIYLYSKNSYEILFI